MRAEREMQNVNTFQFHVNFMIVRNKSALNEKSFDEKFGDFQLVSPTLQTEIFDAIEKAYGTIN